LALVPLVTSFMASFAKDSRAHIEDCNAAGDAWV